jgi:hypothetical protein
LNSAGLRKLGRSPINLSVLSMSRLRDSGVVVNPADGDLAITNENPVEIFEPAVCTGCPAKSIHAHSSVPMLFMKTSRTQTANQPPMRAWPREVEARLIFEVKHVSIHIYGLPVVKVHRKRVQLPSSELCLVRNLGRICNGTDHQPDCCRKSAAGESPQSVADY